MLYQDGRFRAIHPVLVRRYRLDVDHPEGVAAGRRLTVRVRATALVEAPAPPRVGVRVTNWTALVEAAATRRPNGTYVATLSTADLAPGRYSVFAAVGSNRRPVGRRRSERRLDGFRRSDG